MIAVNRENLTMKWKGLPSKLILMSAVVVKMALVTMATLCFFVLDRIEGLIAAKKGVKSNCTSQVFVSICG